MTKLIAFETKLARFCEEQERKQMSKSFRHQVAKKLKETILKSTDPKEIASLANQLAKFLPNASQPRTKRDVPPPLKAKEPSLEELVVAMEKKHKGVALTDAETKFVAGVENKRSESAEVA